MMKKKFSGDRPRMSTANPGPIAPSTPIRLELMPRYARLHAMTRCCRTKAIPSRNWSTSSWTARPAASVAGGATRSGRTAGSGRMASAAAPNMIATRT